MEEEGEDIMTFKENNKVRGERTRGEMLEFFRELQETWLQKTDGR